MPKTILVMISDMLDKAEGDKTKVKVVVQGCRDVSYDGKNSRSVGEPEL